MAVFREGYDAVRLIQSQSKRVWNDACDWGAPCNKEDEIWKAVKTLHSYRMGDEPKEKYEANGKDKGGYFEVELMDEWAVSDGRKTDEEAIDRFRVSFWVFGTGTKRNFNMDIDFRNSHGFATVEQIGK